MTLFRRIYLFIIISVFLICFQLGYLRLSVPHPWRDRVWQHQQPVTLSPRVPCLGARGKLLNESIDDQLRAEELPLEYPEPLAGSHTALRLDLTWMTAARRYGPYGFGQEDQPTPQQSSNSGLIDWEMVDWKELQNQCLERNHARFPTITQPFNNTPRFRLRHQVKDGAKLGSGNWGDSIDTPLTGRIALILRTHDEYDYKEIDLLNLRSLMTEVALGSGGEYTVVLLVNVKDKNKRIHESKEKYDAAFKAANIPREFHGITVLWDENLLDSWYPNIDDHSIMFQVYQATQLFALFYPEFDHYWQWEMDIRILGDTLRYLEAVSTFARNEPRKQSVERSSYLHISKAQGSYSEFMAAVNLSLNGGATIWGPLRIPDITPIGPPPPTPHPEDDNFSWGVGEDADVIVTNPCSKVLEQQTWVFRSWIGGFRNSTGTPRITCPTAIMRGSRQLLLAVHDAQANYGLYLPSEATLPSFALWHGLKLSYPPWPWYSNLRHDEKFMDEFFNGGLPASHSDGWAHGEGFYNQLNHPDLTAGSTWWWYSDFPDQIMKRWFLRNGTDAYVGEEMPFILKIYNGEVWAPNVALHPAKWH